MSHPPVTLRPRRPRTGRPLRRAAAAHGQVQPPTDVPNPVVEVVGVGCSPPGWCRLVVLGPLTPFAGAMLPRRMALRSAMAELVEIRQLRLESHRHSSDQCFLSGDLFGGLEEVTGAPRLVRASRFSDRYRRWGNVSCRPRLAPGPTAQVRQTLTSSRWPRLEPPPGCRSTRQLFGGAPRRRPPHLPTGSWLAFIWWRLSASCWGQTGSEIRAIIGRCTRSPAMKTTPWSMGRTS